MTDEGATVAITGGAGFLGATLARRLLDKGDISLDGAAAVPLQRLLLLDVVAPRDPSIVTDPRVTVIIGDLTDTLAEVDDLHAVFHLAGVVSGAAEADFELGMRTNLDSLRVLLDHLRALESTPLLVFTSSLAVFGQDPYGPLLDVVDDDTLPRPQSSYGVQKFIGEQLVADYTRRGFVRGRTVRLMTVSVRPGAPNAAASSFMSGIIREPLAGTRSNCPIAEDTPIALSSPGRTLDGILRAAAVSAPEWGSRTAMNLPALTTTPREMVAALEVVSPGAGDLVDWKPDPGVAAIVGTWPSRFVTPRAESLDLTPAPDFLSIVREYVRENASAVARPATSA